MNSTNYFQYKSVVLNLTEIYNITVAQLLLFYRNIQNKSRMMVKLN